MIESSKKNVELVLNGVLEEEVGQYLHVCFYTDGDGPDLNNLDRYIFVPKEVGRVVDARTVCIQEWYVQKKKLTPFIRGRQKLAESSIDLQRAKNAKKEIEKF